MGGSVDVERISALFEAAAFDPSSLPAACDETAALLGANTFYLLGLSEAKPAVIGGASVQGFIGGYYDEGWWRIDVLTQAVQARKVTGFRLEQSIVPEEVRRRAEIVHDFRRKLDMHWCAGWGFEFEDAHWGFAALRGTPFDASDGPIFAQIAPAITRAAMFAARLNLARAKGMADGLEAANYAAVVLDHCGRSILATSRAEALFDSMFGLRGGALWSADATANAGLAAIAACAREGGGAPAPAVAAPRAPGRRPVLVLPLRVRGAGADGLPGARLVLSLIDLDARPRPLPALLCEIYGLTPAEARVASRLCAGLEPEAIAEEMSVRASTVRQHLKAALAKTETHRQAELVALLARLPAI